MVIIYDTLTVNYTKQEKIEVFFEPKKNKRKIISSNSYNYIGSEFETKMIEGYLAMADENKMLAEQSLPTTLETWPKWKED